MFHLDDLGPPAPRLPARRWESAALPLALSACAHLVVASMLVALVAMRSAAPAAAIKPAPEVMALVDTRHIVFIAHDPLPVGGGGGGGGNREPGPIRHAQAIGTDKMTLRVAKPTSLSSLSSRTADLPSLPALMLDARPLASGTFEQVGLPTGGESFGTSTGSGSGGGVGEGSGTGIGSGLGPGIGAGSGGGIGGGIYRPGGSVTPPRVVTEVKPAYTNEAARQRIEGTVVLELVVTRDGRPSDIRVIRSLDAKGLDQQAVIAASQWRFEPGRLAGEPVDVLVTVMLDFWIR